VKTYNSLLIPRARAVRQVMTPAERHLWLHCLRDISPRFRRQRPVGRFIVDFYCAALKLVIEVDGDSHYSDDGVARDIERTAFLESLGIRVLRFANTEVLRQTDQVREVISSSIATLALTPSPLRGTPPIA